MKILRVTSSGYIEGGAEAGLVHVQPILEKRGHEVRTLSSDSRPDMPHFNYYSYRAPHGIFRRLMYSFNFSAYIELKKALKDFEPDIVHLHTLGAASPSVLFALCSTPTIATVHGPEGYTKNLLLWCHPKSDFVGEEFALRKLRFAGLLRHFYYRFINYPLYALGLRNVDAFITISSYIHNLMLRQGIQSTNVNNGIKLLSYEPLTKEDFRHAIVFSGRLEKFKGLEFVLKALPAVLERFPDTVLYVAGTGQEENELKKMAYELGVVQSVRFLGYQTHEDLEKVYRESSVGVVPSIWPEVSSRSGIEISSVGRPIIASNVGGITDWLIDHETGFAVPPKDPEAIANALMYLFSHPDEAIRIGANARRKSEEYDIEKHARKVEVIYEQVLRSYGKAGDSAPDSSEATMDSNAVQSLL